MGALMCIHPSVSIMNWPHHILMEVGVPSSVWTYNQQGNTQQVTISEQCHVYAGWRVVWAAARSAMLLTTAACRVGVLTILSACLEISLETPQDRRERCPGVWKPKFTEIGTARLDCSICFEPCFPTRKQQPTQQAGTRTLCHSFPSGETLQHHGPKHRATGWRTPCGQKHLWLGSIWCCDRAAAVGRQWMHQQSHRQSNAILMTQLP